VEIQLPHDVSSDVAQLHQHSRDVHQPTDVSQQHQQSLTKTVPARDINSTEAFLQLEANLCANEAEAQVMTFTYERNVDTEIHQERLPNTSVHVLEEIIESQDDTQQGSADGATVATHQSSFMDVMALEHSANMQTRPTDTEANLCFETHDVNNIPVGPACNIPLVS
jgi:hypothetical protein